MEKENKASGTNIVKNQLWGEGSYSELRVPIVIDDAILKQCCIIALKAWAKVEKQGWSESFTNITHGSDESFTDFLQRLTSALNRKIFNPNAREF